MDFPHFWLLGTIFCLIIQIILYQSDNTINKSWCFLSSSIIIIIIIIMIIIIIIIVMITWELRSNQLLNVASKPQFTGSHELEHHCFFIFLNLLSQSASQRRRRDLTIMPTTMIIMIMMMIRGLIITTTTIIITMMMTTTTMIMIIRIRIIFSRQIKWVYYKKCQKIWSTKVHRSYTMATI